MKKTPEKTDAIHIPSMAHLIWTGHRPIPLERMREIAKVASFGKDVDEKSNDGLEVHLWVDDAARFKNLYERMRISSLKNVGDIEVMPSKLNCVLHSIGELGCNGLDNDKSRMVEALLMKAEIYKGQGRNKPTSAADVIKALVLDQKGGVYFDLRTALGFVEVLEKKGAKKFGSMPEDVRNNFLTVRLYEDNAAGGAGYAIARPNSNETLEMVQQLYGRILNSHKLAEQPDNSMMQQIGVRLRNAQRSLIASEFTEDFLQAERGNDSLDAQARQPEIMNQSYYYGMSGRGDSIGSDILIHTSGWVFADVYRKFPQSSSAVEEARKITQAMFGTEHDCNVSIGAWQKFKPSKRSDMDDGMVGMGAGVLNKAWDEKRAIAKENRSMVQEDWESRNRERLDAEKSKPSSSIQPTQSMQKVNGGGYCTIM